MRAVVIIPALDEEEAISQVVKAISDSRVVEIIVVDNGSCDKTAQRARESGARVVREPRRGYGSACLAGIREAPDNDVLVFLDGDGSDDGNEIGAMLDLLESQGADMIIGSRVLGQAEPGSLTGLQAFGNALTCNLVRLFWGVRYTDLGPFRAIRTKALQTLTMKDPDFGWTIEMQVKAAQQGLRVLEMPVNYRNRRAGQSKVSGNIVGSYRAGKTILGYVFSAKLKELL